MSRTHLLFILFFITLILSASFFYFYFSRQKDAAENSPIITAQRNKETAVSVSEDPLKDLSDPLKEKIPSILSRIQPPTFPPNQCSIENYGARSGGEELNSLAINKAIDDCASKGGGMVIISEGKWLTGPIKLKSNINLHLKEGAELVFTSDRTQYLPAVFTRLQGMEFYNYSPPIYARDAQNIALTGKGKIVGNGETWWRWAQNTKSRDSREELFEMSKENVPVEKRQFAKEKNGLRPSFVVAINCKNILLEDISVVDGPMWTIHLIYSQNITVRNVDINTWSSNTDGIVLDSSAYALIENSHISAGDDGIAIKSGLEEDGLRVNRPSENVIIRNNRFTKAHGAVAIGSEMSGGVRNILVYNSDFTTTDNGFRLKATDSRGGFVEDVYVENIKMKNIENEAIVIDLSYGSKLSSGADRVPALKNIFIQNIDIQGASQMAKIDGIIDGPMENINFKNIRSDSLGGAYLNEASNVTFENISLPAKSDDPYFEIRESKNIKVKKYSCLSGDNSCFKIKGKKTDNIDLSEASFDKDRADIEKRLVKKVILD